MSHAAEMSRMNGLQATLWPVRHLSKTLLLRVLASFQSLNVAQVGHQKFRGVNESRYI